MKTVTNQIEDLLEKANSLAEYEVNRLAREVLKNNPELASFVMGMGSYFFRANKAACSLFTFDVGNIIHTSMGENLSILRNMTGYKELEDFIARWDYELKLTGSPMILTSKEIETNR